MNTSSLYVLKFGGTSVATPQRISHAASIIQRLIECGHRVVVVVSAMSGWTNQLLDLTKNFIDTSSDRECDTVISSGEQVSSGLLALCLKKNNIPAMSLQGWQIPIITESLFGESNIISVCPNKLLKNLDNGIVSVISGFQGVSERNEITTIGRGGSDATAVAVAQAINADECFIYTDVDGVYSSDPRIVLDAKKILTISYDEMLALALNGAKVLQARSVEIASCANVKLRVLSSFANETHNNIGTVVQNSTSFYISKTFNVAGIAHNNSSFMVAVKSPSHNIELLTAFGNNNIKFNQFNGSCFLIEKTRQHDVSQLLNSFNYAFNFDNDIGVVTIVGDITPPLEYSIINELRHRNINIKNQNITDISMSIVVPFQQTEMAVYCLHNMLY